MAESGLIIRRLADDVVSLKEQMTRIEITLNEIDKDIHREINPEYLKKLEKIQKQQGIRFTTAEEFDEYFSG
jgi:hypothetical protein